MRAVARHTVLRSVVVWVLLAPMSGCTWSTVWYGAEFYGGARNRLELASQAPHCGCLALENVYQQPEGDPLWRRVTQRVTGWFGRSTGEAARPGETILLRTTFSEQPRGETLLIPGESIDERFDWAGPDTDDRYHLQAFSIEWTDDTRTTPRKNSDGHYVIVDPLPIERALAKPREPRFLECEELQCQYGELRLDQMVNYQTTWAGAEVNETAQSIELAAPEPQCGCVTLRNTTDHNVEVSATFFSRPRGRTVLLLAGEQTRALFDWAGPLGEDRYSIQAFNPDAPEPAAPGPAASGPAASGPGASGPAASETDASETDASESNDPHSIDQLELLHLPPVFRDCEELACEYGALQMNQVAVNAPNDSQTQDLNENNANNSPADGNPGTDSVTGMRPDESADPAVSAAGNTEPQG